MVKTTKVVIIGGGPAGLTAAIYCGRANLNPVVAAGGVEGGLMPGGQLMTTTEVENYPGFPEGISGPDLMKRFRSQAERFGTTIIEDWVSDCDFSARPFKMKIGQEDYEAECVIVATGAVAKWLNLPEEDKYKNNGISACATCDGPLPVFKNEHIFVVGGGDTAMEEATFLTKFASKVTIVHRRDELRASKIMQTKAQNNPKIEFMWNSAIVEYEGDDSDPEDVYLTGLKIKNTVTGEITSHKCAGLFMGIGHQPMTKFLGTQLELDKQGYISVRDHIHTNIEGVFACGDVHDTHYRQAISAAGLGCMAAISAERWLENQ